MGLEKYDVRKYIPFNFLFSTENSKLQDEARILLTDIKAYTGRKDDVKKEFMVKLLLNLNLGWRTSNMISISRGVNFIQESTRDTNLIHKVSIQL